MSNNMIPFPTDGALPSYLTKSENKVDLSAFFANVHAGFPVLSIKGKTWALVRDGERKILPDPEDPDEPARYVVLTLLAANKNLSKVYYKDGYEDGSSEKPTCYSNDGIAPGSEAADPQSKTCAACPHNVWGSGNNGKGKACSDSRRVAVVPSGRLDDPMLLRVPPASLKSLAEYAGELARRNVPMQAVATRVRFDPNEATPKLVFKAEGLLSEEQYKEAVSTSKSDMVQQILGTGQPGESAEPAVSVQPEEVEEAVKAKPEPKPEPKKEAKKAAPKKEPDPVSVAADELVDDLDKLLGDDFDG